VTRPPDWSTVDVPGAGTSCYPQVESIPGSAFSPPFNLPLRGLIAIFLVVNPPVMVARSVAHCSYIKGDKLRLCYNNKFATRTLSFAKILLRSQVAAAGRVLDRSKL
jgi:hypothetical protein